MFLVHVCGGGGGGEGYGRTWGEQLLPGLCVWFVCLYVSLEAGWLYDLQRRDSSVGSTIHSGHL